MGRMIRPACGFSLLLSAALCVGQMQMADMPGAPDSRPVVLVEGLGTAHHRIRTSSPEAQRYFDQGLDYLYAFNHDEARRSFERAAQLDPKAAMLLWGVALAVGANFNDIDIGQARAEEAGAADCVGQAI